MQSGESFEIDISWSPNYEVLRKYNANDILATVKLLQRSEQMHIPEHDPFSDGTVVRYTRMLSGNSYTYVAIRAAGQWYASSSDISKAMTWQEFSDLLFSERTSNVEVVANWIPWDDAVIAMLRLQHEVKTIEASGETWVLRDTRPDRNGD